MNLIQARKSDKDIFIILGIGDKIDVKVKANKNDAHKTVEAVECVSLFLRCRRIGDR